MERFPALRLILRLGRAGAAVVALIVAALVVGWGWPTLGWLSVLTALFAFAFSYFLVKSYVEIVQIITEMVH